MESAVQFLLRLWAWFCELNVYTVYQSRFFQSTPGRCSISLDISFKLNSPFISPKLICEHVKVAWQVAWLLPLSWRPCKLLQIMFCVKTSPLFSEGERPSACVPKENCNKLVYFYFVAQVFLCHCIFNEKIKCCNLRFGLEGQEMPPPRKPLYFSINK